MQHQIVKILAQSIFSSFEIILLKRNNIIAECFLTYKWCKFVRIISTLIVLWGGTHNYYSTRWCVLSQKNDLVRILTPPQTHEIDNILFFLL